jgi:hypothetical protein
MGGNTDPASGRPEGSDPTRAPTLWRVVIPRQNLVVRRNGLNPDGPEDGYLASVVPYGIFRMAWAIWREVPDATPKNALSLALRVRREDEAEVLVASGFLAEHVPLGLLARYQLGTRLEWFG